MAQLDKDLQKLEKLAIKLVNKLKRRDLDYTIQASINSTDRTVVRYAVQITSPANGLMPITFIGLTPEELFDKIKVATKNIDYDKVEEAYHEAQILACERTIQGHKERIEEIKNPPKDNNKEEVVEDEQSSEDNTSQETGEENSESKSEDSAESK